MRALLALTLSLFSFSATAADLRIEGAWVRATIASQRTTGAFMTLTSPIDATLVGVHSPAAGKLELHETKMPGGVMKMRAIDRIALPAGKPVALEPGGKHIMIFALKEGLAAGNRPPLELEVESAGKNSRYRIEAEVRPLNAEAPVPHHRGRH